MGRTNIPSIKLTVKDQSLNTIGIRTKPDSFIIAVYNSESSEIVNIESVKIPKALDIPERLKYARTTILDIIREYEIDKAGIRIPESNAQKINLERTQIEAVIQEAFASSSLTKYYCGQIARISRLLDFDRSNFKPYVEGTLNFKQVENWLQLDKLEREAALAAIGASYV